MASRNTCKKRKAWGAALVVSRLPSAQSTIGRSSSKRDHVKESSFRSMSIDASTKNAPSGILRLGKSNSLGQKTSSGSNRRGQVSTEKSILARGKPQSRASAFSSLEMSHARLRNLRRKNNFFHASMMRIAESNESLGTRLVRNGGTDQSSTEIRLLEN